MKRRTGTRTRGHAVSRGRVLPLLVLRLIIRRQPLSIETHDPRSGWIARYAWSSRVDEHGERRPSDYHKVLLKRLKTLDAKLREQFGAFESRAYVDTGPVVERSLATAAGLGWTGKNTCLIHPKLGSFGFLAVLLTSLDVSPKRKQRSCWSDHCGTCSRCLEACPTGALTTPYKMDATKCISYLTIEHKGTIAPELMAGMGRQVFGCDICQDVCPWNRKAPISGGCGTGAAGRTHESCAGMAGLVGRAELRAHLQRIAGASGRLSGNASQHRHRHGQQRRPELCTAPQGMG